jgi:hypothetical protein
MQDLAGPLVVVTSASEPKSIAVATTRASNFVNITVAITQGAGTYVASSKERVRTGQLINLVANGTTYTNLCIPGQSCRSTPQNLFEGDPVTGTYDVAAFNPAAGVLDITFHAVALPSVSGKPTCVIDGQLVTTGVSFP